MQRVLLKKIIKKKKLREREIEKRNERKTRYPAALKDALPPLNTVQPRQGPGCFLPPDSPACSEEPRPAALPASVPQPRGCSRRPYGTIPPSLPRRLSADPRGRPSAGEAERAPSAGGRGDFSGQKSGVGALRCHPLPLQRLCRWGSESWCQRDGKSEVKAGRGYRRVSFCPPRPPLQHRPRLIVDCLIYRLLLEVVPLGRELLGFAGVRNHESLCE